MAQFWPSPKFCEHSSCLSLHQSPSPDGSPARPFPWHCPRCGRKEVNRTVVSYQCQRLHQGQPVVVVISDLAVPKCGHCGELVFDYLTEQQIDQAFIRKRAR